MATERYDGAAAAGSKPKPGDPAQERARGLPSIEEARKARGKLRFPPTKFWGYAGLILAITLILHWKYTEGENEHARQKLLAQQRSVKAELGPRWDPMRDKVERWTLELAAKDPGPEVVDTEALAGWDFQKKPGIYLRMRATDVADAAAIRKGAKDSLKDAFTSCLVQYDNPSAVAGIDCRHSRDCPNGEYCNETDHCSKAAQPFNLRVAYRTMHILSDEWVTEVQEAGTDIRLRLFTTSFDDTLRDDVPLAIELLTRAQYYLVVLDEPSKDPKSADAGSVDLQALAHVARVGLWRLADGKQVLRLRREAAGQLLGGVPPTDDAVLAASRRQANSCALALEVRKAMGDPNVPAIK